MSKSRKHHFVPWSYLRNFAYNPEAPRKNSKIYMLDKPSGHKDIMKTDKVKCYVKGQNTVNELSDPEFFEKRYASVDAALGETMRLLIDSVRGASENSVFSESDKVLLARHIMLLFKRQPSVFKDAESKVESAYDDVKEMLKNEYNDRLTEHEIEKILSRKSPKQHTLKLSTELVGDGVKALCNKVWVYIRNETNSPFITSDYPLCPQRAPDYSGKRMSDSGLLFYFPIAPDILIYMIDSVHFDNGKEDLFRNLIRIERDQDFVLTANKLQYNNCTRQIYSNQSIDSTLYNYSDDDDINS